MSTFHDKQMKEPQEEDLPNPKKPKLDSMHGNEKEPQLNPPKDENGK